MKVEIIRVKTVKPARFTMMELVMILTSQACMLMNLIVQTQMILCLKQKVIIDQ